MLRVSIFILIISCLIGCKDSSDKKKDLTSDLSVEVEKPIFEFPKKKKKGQNPFDFKFMQRAYPSGKIKTSAYSEAIQWKSQTANRSTDIRFSMYDLPAGQAG